MSEDLLALFRQTSALLDGHFVLHSGLHRRQYFQCALLLQHTEIAAKVCGWLAEKLRGFACDAVVSLPWADHCRSRGRPRTGEAAHFRRQRSQRPTGLRRGFKIKNGERYIVAEDVVTRGGRVQETIDIFQAHGAIVAAVGIIVDRNGKSKPAFGCPLVSLIELDVETFPAENLPPDLAAIPAEKRGSK